MNNEFQNFVFQWGIIQKSSSPRYAQSNGFIERHVQTIKKLLKKSLYDNKNMYSSLVELRNTLLSRDTPSPAQLLFGTRLREYLPMKAEFLKPVYINEQYHDSYLDNERKQKWCYDRNAKSLPNLSIGDNVMVQINSKTWEPGKIIKVDTDRPRSYFVKLNKNNKVYMRNRKCLVSRNNFVNQTNFEYDQILENFITTRTSHNETNFAQDLGIHKEAGLTNNLVMEKGKGNVSDPEKTKSGRVIVRPK